MEKKDWRIDIFSVLIGAVFSAIITGTATYYTMRTTWETAVYQTEKAQENWLKQNQISNDQKKHEAQLASQLDYLTKLRDSYNELNSLREQFYSNKYPILISKIVYNKYPTTKENKEIYDKTLSLYGGIEPDLISKINTKKANFKSLLDNSKNSFTNEQLKKYIDIAMTHTDQFYTEINENELANYYFSQLNVTNDLNKAYDITFTEYTKQSQSYYSLPVSFKLLTQSMEDEYNLNKAK